MNNPAPRRTDGKDKLPVGITYWAILASTVFLLLVAILSLLIGLAFGLESDSNPSFPSGGEGNQPGSTTTAPSGTGGSDTTSGKPIYPTVADRDSYLFTTGADAQSISGISSQHAILVSLETYTSVAEKEADTKIYPASMFKVMSLLVACERVTDMTEMVTVAAEDVQYAAEMGGSGVASLRAGEAVKMEDLLYLTSYNSDTVAVLTVAKHLAGSEEAFVGWMNDKAKELGLTNTSFANCTGLHHENNYTTCREMATIMAYALENQMCNKLLTSYRGWDIETSERELLIYSGWYSVRYDNNPHLKTVTVKGGKTGYEDIPTSTFVTYAVDDNGKGYVCVVVGRSDTAQTKVTNAASTADTSKLYNTYVK